MQQCSLNYRWGNAVDSCLVSSGQPVVKWVHDSSPEDISAAVVHLCLSCRTTLATSLILNSVILHSTLLLQYHAKDIKKQLFLKCFRCNLIFTIFYVNRKIIGFLQIFDFRLLMDLHDLGCPEHNLTISRKCLFVYLCVHDKNFVANVARELNHRISLNIVFNVI